MSRMTLLPVIGFLVASVLWPVCARAQDTPDTGTGIAPTANPGLPFDNVAGGALSSRSPGNFTKEAINRTREITQTIEERDAPRDPTTRKKSVQILLAIVEGLRTAFETEITKLLAGLNLANGDLGSIGDLLGLLGKTTDTASDQTGG